MSRKGAILDEWGEDAVRTLGQRVRDAAPDLLAALEAVEWINIGYSSEVYVCAWCGGDEPHRSAAIVDGVHPIVGGHRPDCPRQAAIKKARG